MPEVYRAAWTCPEKRGGLAGPRRSQAANGAPQEFRKTEPASTKTARAHCLLGEICRGHALNRFARLKFETAKRLDEEHVLNWLPACAGMTVVGASPPRRQK